MEVCQPCFGWNLLCRKLCMNLLSCNSYHLTIPWPSPTSTASSPGAATAQEGRQVWLRGLETFRDTARNKGVRCARTQLQEDGGERLRTGCEQPQVGSSRGETGTQAPSCWWGGWRSPTIITQRWAESLAATMHATLPRWQREEHNAEEAAAKMSVCVLWHWYC